MSDTIAPAAPVTQSGESNDSIESKQAPIQAGNVTKQVAIKADPMKSEAVSKADELYEIIVNGKKQSLTKDQLITKAQKAEAAEQRMRQASSNEKLLAEIMEAIDNDFEGSLKRLGKDPDQLIERYIEHKAKMGSMTPEQRKQLSLEQELAKYKAQEAKTNAEKAAEAQKQIQERTYAKVESDFVAAADKYNLPANADTGLLMLDIAIEYAEYGINLTPDQVAQEVIHRQEEHIKARDAKIMGNMTPAQLRAYLGEDKVKALMAESLKQIPNPTKPKAKPVQEEEQPDRPMSEQEMRARMKKRGFKLS